LVFHTCIYGALTRLTLYYLLFITLLLLLSILQSIVLFYLHTQMKCFFNFFSFCGARDQVQRLRHVANTLLLSYAPTLSKSFLKAMVSIFLLCSYISEGNNELLFALATEIC
jgi:hypothetical protein